MNAKIKVGDEMDKKSQPRHFKKEAIAWDEVMQIQFVLETKQRNTLYTVNKGCGNVLLSMWPPQISAGSDDGQSVQWSGRRPPLIVTVTETWHFEMKHVNIFYINNGLNSYV